MLVEVSLANQILAVDPASPVVTIKQVSLPNQIKIKFSGKIHTRDTKVDSAGNILQDMYVKIVGLKIDNLKVPNWVLHKKLSYVTDGDSILNTSYIGFNGVMTVDIPETNIFAFYRRLNNDN
jgi:hypothetical protein